MGADEIAIHVQQIEDRAMSNTKRLDKMEQRQDNLDKLVTAVAGMQQDLEHTQGDVQEIKGDVKAMMETPVQRTREEPTERSIWPVIMTQAIPRAIVPTITVFWLLRIAAMWLHLKVLPLELMVMA